MGACLRAPDEEDVSYVTMLWPMMAIPVDMRLVTNGQEGVRYKLQHLSAQGIFTPSGWDRVLIDDNLDSGALLLSVTPRLPD